MMLDWIDIVVIAAIVVVVILPPQYDPAIRLKEWLDDRDQ